MMNLEKQVCSIEYSRKLNQLGIKQESQFHWMNEHSMSPNLHFTPYGHGLGLSAFTAAELGEMLPYNIDNGAEFYYPNYTKHLNYHRIQLLSDTGKMLSGFNDFTEADVRAKLLIYLIENKLIEVPV